MCSIGSLSIFLSFTLLLWFTHDPVCVWVFLCTNMLSVLLCHTCQLNTNHRSSRLKWWQRWRSSLHLAADAAFEHIVPNVCVCVSVIWWIWDVCHLKSNYDYDEFKCSVWIIELKNRLRMVWFEIESNICETAHLFGKKMFNPLKYSTLSIPKFHKFSIQFQFSETYNEIHSL